MVWRHITVLDSLMTIKAKHNIRQYEFALRARPRATNRMVTTEYNIGDVVPSNSHWAKCWPCTVRFTLLIWTSPLSRLDECRNILASDNLRRLYRYWSKRWQLKHQRRPQPGEFCISTFANIVSCQNVTVAFIIHKLLLLYYCDLPS